MVTVAAARAAATPEGLSVPARTVRLSGGSGERVLSRGAMIRVISGTSSWPTSSPAQDISGGRDVCRMKPPRFDRCLILPVVPIHEGLVSIQRRQHA
jgi:hypothetical protein